MAKKWVFIVLAILVFILLFIFIKSRGPTGAVVGVAEEDSNDESTILDPDSAMKDDIVKINYVLRLAEDNSVVDTNNVELAEQAGLVSYVKGPFAFILGKSGKVKGFDDAIIGMKAGEKKEVTISPSEPKTMHTFDINKKIRRNTIIPRQQVFPLERYAGFFNRKPVAGDVVYNPTFPWLYRVLNFTENSVLAEIVIKVGDEVTLSGTKWNSVVLQVTNRTITFRQNPEDGSVIDTEFGQAKISLEDRGYITIEHNPILGNVINFGEDSGVPGFSITSLFKITEVTEDTFTIERIDNLAEKELILEIEVLSIE